MLRRIALCVPMILVGSVVPASPCSCAGTSGWAEVARAAPVVVVGEVVSVGEVRRGNGVSDPESVELEVQSTRKGRVSARRIRVWNEMAGSSCGGALLELVVGVRASVALIRVADVATDRRELWEYLTFRPLLADYIVAHSACGTTYQILKDRADLQNRSNGQPNRALQPTPRVVAEPFSETRTG